MSISFGFDSPPPLLTVPDVEDCDHLRNLSILQTRGVNEKQKSWNKIKVARAEGAYCHRNDNGVWQRRRRSLALTTYLTYVVISLNIFFSFLWNRGSPKYFNL